MFNDKKHGSQLQKAMHEAKYLRIRAEVVKLHDVSGPSESSKRDQG